MFIILEFVVAFILVSKTNSFMLHIRFVSSILPSGSENLKGNEAETIIKFKDALGIDDPDAALVHVEVILF